MGWLTVHGEFALGVIKNLLGQPLFGFRGDYSIDVRCEQRNRSFVCVCRNRSDICFLTNSVVVKILTWILVGLVMWRVSLSCL